MRGREHLISSFMIIIYFQSMGNGVTGPCGARARPHAGMEAYQDQGRVTVPFLSTVATTAPGTTWKLQVAC